MGHKNKDGSPLSIFRWKVPIPDDPKLHAAYLALGWQEIKAAPGEPPMLCWSHPRGTPVHPGSVDDDGSPRPAPPPKVTLH